MSFPRFFFLAAAFLVFKSVSFSQSGFFVPDDPPDKKRRNTVYIGYAAGVSASYAGLYHLWYKKNGLSDFSTLNDNNHWLQMDKAGHAATACQMGVYGITMLRWAGVDDRAAIWQGGLSGLLFLTGIEIFDGFSNDYGFSWGDQAANVFGSAFVTGQELLWNEQRLRLKFSYHPTEYARHRPELLGKSPVETWLKDYNGQTYWLSFSPGSFNENLLFPEWLCLSLGYSASGMTGSYRNPAFNSAGTPIPEFPRYRQYFFSLDVDLTRLEPRSGVLRTLFSAFGFVKIPFPALEYSSMEGLRLRPFYF
jgi:hypothetical protein